MNPIARVSHIEGSRTRCHGLVLTIGFGPVPVCGARPAGRPVDTGERQSMTLVHQLLQARKLPLLRHWRERKSLGAVPNGDTHKGIAGFDDLVRRTRHGQ